MDKLGKILLPKNYEAGLGQNEVGKTCVVIVGAEKLTSALKNAIAEIVPAEVDINFEQGPLISTSMGLRSVLGQGFSVDGLKATRSVVIKAKGEITAEQLDTVNEIVSRDPWPKSWEVWVNGQKVLDINRKLAEEVGKNLAAHTRSLTDDDLLNLKIELERCTTVEDFIERAFA
jgi:hypothetical protein